MKRTITLRLVVSRTFDRAAPAAARAARERALRELSAALPGWTVSARTSSSAKRERAPKVIRVGKRAAEREELRGKLRAIHERLIAVLAPTAPRGKFRIAGDPRCCSTRAFGGNRAHTHTRGASWARGLVCWHPKAIRRSDSELVRIAAHELTHLRLPGTNHKNRRFKDAEYALVAAYDARWGTALAGPREDYGWWDRPAPGAKVAAVPVAPPRPPELRLAQVLAHYRRDPGVGYRTLLNRCDGGGRLSFLTLGAAIRDGRVDFSRTFALPIALAARAVRRRFRNGDL